MLKSNLDNLTLLGDRIVVQPELEEKVMKSGIVIPDSASNTKKKHFTGKVLKAGKGRLLKDGKREEMVVKEGDSVIFHRYTGVKVTSVENTFVLLRQRDVECVVTES